MFCRAASVQDHTDTFSDNSSTCFANKTHNKNHMCHVPLTRLSSGYKNILHNMSNIQYFLESETAIRIHICTRANM